MGCPRGRQHEGRDREEGSPGVEGRGGYRGGRPRLESSLCGGNAKLPEVAPTRGVGECRSGVGRFGVGWHGRTRSGW